MHGLRNKKFTTCLSAWECIPFYNNDDISTIFYRQKLTLNPYGHPQLWYHQQPSESWILSLLWRSYTIQIVASLVSEKSVIASLISSPLHHNLLLLFPSALSAFLTQMFSTFRRAFHWLSVHAMNHATGCSDVVDRPAIRGLPSRLRVYNLRNQNRTVARDNGQHCSFGVDDWEDGIANGDLNINRLEWFKALMSRLTVCWNKINVVSIDRRSTIDE